MINETDRMEHTVSPSALLAFLSALDTDIIVALWALTLVCVLAVCTMAALLASSPRTEERDPGEFFARLAGVVRTGRHAAIGEQVWRPAHTRASTRGGHHAGRGRWRAPLVDKLDEGTIGVSEEMILPYRGVAKVTKNVVS